MRIVLVLSALSLCACMRLGFREQPAELVDAAPPGDQSQLDRAASSSEEAWPSDAAPTPDRAPDGSLQDMPWPDTKPWPDLTPLPVCPGTMASFGTFCIDKDDTGSLTWVRAAEFCMSKGKRLCSTTEWSTACSSSGKGMVDMTGAYEWLYELASDTSAKKRGASTCASASSHGVTTGTYDTRCCVN